MSTDRSRTDETTSDDDESTAQRVTERAKDTADKVMTLFPVRVWQRFGDRNGQILAAGASYQALFAIFAAVYVAFAIVGVWLGGNSDAVDTLIRVLNSYLPGFISTADGEQGIVTAEQVAEIAQASGATLSVTGLVAFGVLLWTAISWIGSLRTTVRGIFGLPMQRGNAALLIVRDLLAAAFFAVLLLIGAGLGLFSTGAISWLFELLGWGTSSPWFGIVAQLVAISVMFIVDTVLLIALFRFLSGTTLRARNVLPGSLLGAAAMTVLQLAFGLLIGKAPNNPLLTTFAVLIGMLLWIRLVMMAILLAAAWVAESAAENDIVLDERDEHERAFRRAVMLERAAVVEVDEAEAAVADAGWLQKFGAHRRLRYARSELTRRQAGVVEAAEHSKSPQAAAVRLREKSSRDA